jgi:hypothetical protein
VSNRRLRDGLTGRQLRGNFCRQVLQSSEDAPGDAGAMDFYLIGARIATVAKPKPKDAIAAKRSSPVASLPRGHYQAIIDIPGSRTEHSEWWQ